MTGYIHTPVLLEAVVRALRPAAGELIVDCTVGGGGHAAALLEAAPVTVIGLDRDPAALAEARQTCARFGSRFRAVRASFGDLAAVLDAEGVGRVHGLLADLGVSSHQLDTPSRGFSFRHRGPLDMRMDPDGPLTAEALVNTWAPEAIRDILVRYGEERRARRVARAIVDGRPWRDTASLADAVAGAVGGRRGRIHPATRTFQALRIAVNAELDQLEALLPAAVERLERGGRLALISFHSLEDRVIKHFLAERAGRGRPRDPYGEPLGAVDLALEANETSSPDDPNPRARSARLRSARRL